MEFIVNIFSQLGGFFGSIVDFGSYVQSNIIILMLAVVIFAIATVVLRSIFKILLFIPVLIFATIITIWTVNYITGNTTSESSVEVLPNWQNFEAW